MKKKDTEDIQDLSTAIKGAGHPTLQPHGPEWCLPIKMPSYSYFDYRAQLHFIVCLSVITAAKQQL